MNMYEDCLCDENEESSKEDSTAQNRLARENLLTQNAEKLADKHQKQLQHLDALKQATKVALERCQSKQNRRKHREEHYVRKAEKKALAEKHAHKKELLKAIEKEEEEEEEEVSARDEPEEKSPTPHKKEKISPKADSGKKFKPISSEASSKLKNKKSASPTKSRIDDEANEKLFEDMVIQEFEDIQKEEAIYDEAVRDFVKYELISETDLSITTPSNVSSLMKTEEFPLTRETHDRFVYNVQENAAWNKKEKEIKDQKCQDRILLLKEQLDKNRKEFNCHLDLRLQKAAQIEEECKKKLKQSLKIDASFPPKAASIIVDRIRKFRKDKVKLKQAQQERYSKIIEKIIKEENRTRKLTISKFKIKKKPKSKFKINVKKIPKIEDEYDLKTLENEPLSDSNDNEGEKTINKIPPALLNSEQVSEEWYNLLEEDSLSKTDIHIGLSTETSLTCHPSFVHFKNFEPNFIYRKKITLLNKGSITLYIRLAKIEVDNYDVKSLEVKPQDVKKLLPGLSFSILVKFSPWKCTKELKGAIIFITWRNPLVKPIQERQQFVVPILCEKIKAEPALPKNFVKFQPVAVWNIKRSGFYKKFEVSNHGHKTCVLRIAAFDASKEIFENPHEIKVNSNGAGDELSLNMSVELMKTIITETVDECISNVFQMFRWDVQYFVSLPSQSTQELKIYFNPRGQLGFIRKQFVFEFYDMDEESILLKAQVEASAEVFGLPLTLSTPVLDLGLVTTDGFLTQGLVTTRTSSRVPIEVEWRVPRKLAPHVQVIPRRAYVHPGPHSGTTFVVRLQPSWRILKNHIHYDPESSILDFSCRMYALSPPITSGSKPSLLGPGGMLGSWAGAKPLLLRVLATVTSPDFLNIEPAQIDLGSVTTNETVSVNLKLTNYSLAKLRYGFLNLPKNVCIMPSYGFGEIISGQELDLCMLYSPKKEDILSNTENFACVQGLAKFQIEVRSMQSVGGSGEGIRNLHLLQEDLEENRTQIDESESEEEEENETRLNEENKIGDEDMMIVSQKRYQNDDDSIDKVSQQSSTPILSALDELLAAIEKPVSNYSNESLQLHKLSTPTATLVFSKKEPTQSLSQENEIGKQRRYNFKVDVKAWVIDPKCQLDVNKIIFPVTPCLGISIASVKLRSQDMSCLCGIQNFDYKNLYIWFETRSDSEDIEVQPRQGTISRGEETKINIIFKPSLDKNLIEKQTIEMKKIQHEIETRLAKNGKKEKKVKEINTSELTKIDLYTAEKFLLEILEPYKLEANVIIVVKTAFSLDETRQTEIHRISLMCPVSRPLFLIILPTQLIDFGNINVGSRPHIQIPLYNIARRTIVVKSSMANPVGDLFLGICTRNGLIIDPGFVGIVPITFAPSSEVEMNEYIEFHSETTSWTIHVTGHGVLPKYEIKPITSVWRYECKNNKNIDIFLEFKNNGVLPIEFELLLNDSLMALDRDLEISAPKTTKEKSSPKMDVELNEKEQRMLAEGDFFKTPLYIGELWTQKDTSVICPSKTVKKLKITFTPPLSPKKNKKPKKSSRKEELIQVEDFTENIPRLYLAKCELTLNKLTKIRDLHMLVSVNPK